MTMRVALKVTKRALLLEYVEGRSLPYRETTLDAAVAKFLAVRARAPRGQLGLCRARRRR